MSLRLALVAVLILGTSAGAYVLLQDDDTDEHTLALLEERLAACPSDSARATPPKQRCIALVYVWSPTMPLSERGIEEVRRASGAMGLGLTVLPASQIEDEPAASSLDSIRSTLIFAGATVHYPSLVVLEDGHPVGSSIEGYKDSDAYQALLHDRLALADGADPPGPAPLGAPGDLSVAERGFTVVWTHTVEPRPGAFFRWVPGTSYIAFDQRNRVFLRNVATSHQFRGPGFIDFVPDPDGLFFVTPAPDEGGLDFFLASDVFSRAGSGNASEIEPFFTDPLMTDQYPSVGILETDASGRATRYRILVSWFSGLAFRDYDVEWDPAGSPSLTPTTEKLEGCPGQDLSLPILSKDGRELAARDERTGTTKLLRMASDGSCQELFDFGRQTSKVGFSGDGSLIAYSSPDPGRAGAAATSTTYVLDRDAMRTVTVPESVSTGLVIPEFVGADSILVAVRDGSGGPTEFRLSCCAR